MCEDGEERVNVETTNHAKIAVLALLWLWAFIFGTHLVVERLRCEGFERLWKPQAKGMF